MKKDLESAEKEIQKMQEKIKKEESEKNNLMSRLKLEALAREESRKVLETYKTLLDKTRKANIETAERVKLKMKDMKTAAESSRALMHEKVSKVIALTSSNDDLVRNIKDQKEELTKCKEALIEEKEKKTRAELEKNNTIREKTDLLQELNEFVSCPVCLELPRGNRIPICRNGHITCDTCCR